MLEEMFNVPVGFSDHTIGLSAVVGAAILGACWIEKHFTIDHNLAGPDHWFSTDPKELKNLVSEVRAAETIVGHATMEPTESERFSRKRFRLSCVAARDMNASQTVATDDVIYQRPGYGMPPKFRDFIIGSRLRRSIKAGEIFKKDDFIGYREE